ncbi:HepT-like ribonuclease domain-containing protein [uncultured Selenomonas sp.]
MAHGYGNIELAVVWRTALEDIPGLQAFCEKELRD